MRCWRARAHDTDEPLVAGRMQRNSGKTAMLSNTQRNPGTALNTEWIERVRVNTSAVERRTASLAGRRTVKKEYQAAWLVRAIECLDLTTLAGNDTPSRGHLLCP